MLVPEADLSSEADLPSRGRSPFGGILPPCEQTKASENITFPYGRKKYITKQYLQMG